MFASKWCVIKRTFSIWSTHNATRLAAGVAFYTMLAIAPLLVVALRVLSLVYGHGAEAKIGQQVNTFVGNDSQLSPASAIQQMLDVAAHRKPGAWTTIISFAVAVFSGSSLFAALQDALNTIWDVKARGDIRLQVAIRNRIASGAMLFVVAVLMIASFVLSTFVNIVVQRVGGWAVSLTYIGDILVSILIVTVLFAIVYYYLPRVKIDWSDVWLGAGITAGLFIVGRIGLTVYFRFASLNSPYGAAGSLAALLIWVYYSSCLVFFGAAFTRVYAESRGKPIEPDHYAVALPSDDTDCLGRPSPGLPMETIASNDPRPSTSGSGTILKMLISAAAGGIGAMLFNRQGHRLRARAAELRLHDRLERAEQKIRRAGRLTNLLQQTAVHDRMEAVEHRLKDIARRG